MKHLITGVSLVIISLLFFTACKSPWKESENQVSSSGSSPVSVAAAANLRDVLQELKESYLAENPGRKVSLTFGSSGMLTQQIIHGAPFDLFLSADTVFPGKLKGLNKVKGETVIYAYGKVVMWSNRFDVSKGSELVLDEEVRKIAVANPQLAPYGRATVEMLQELNLYDKIESKIVWAENINQTAQFASSGSADIVFISLSNAMGEEMTKRGKFYALSPEEAPPIAQSGVIIKGRNERGAQAFLDYIVHENMRHIWEKYGYEVSR